jgi:peptidoglycan hydrolase-like protein with peptidoglycan-binding domain
MTVFYRADWVAREPRYAPTPIVDTANVVIHYEGSNSDGTLEAVRNIQNYHMDKNGWNDIAYSWLINQNGDVFEGRGWGVRSAANGSVASNADRYAVCFMIGVDEEPSEAALASSRVLVGLAREAKPSASKDITGHRDHIATSCPGQPLYDLVQSGAFEPDFGQVFVNDVPVVEHAPTHNPLTELADGVLQVGEHGVWVEILQKRLVQLGFDPKGVDGVYGYDTAQAVKQFQLQAGIYGDGVAGKQTFGKLDEWENTKRNAVPQFPGIQWRGRYKPDATKTIQSKLNAVSGVGLEIDGVFGTETEKAIKNFQAFFGASVDGVVGKITWALLFGSPTYEVH